jgi:hypothetical protein
LLKVVEQKPQPNPKKPTNYKKTKKLRHENS